MESKIGRNLSRVVWHSDDDEPVTDEAELAVRFCRGDEDALEEALETYWNGVLGFANHLLNDADEAEDVAQEAFIRLWSRRSDWNRADTLRPIIYRVVRNLALNEGRRRRTWANWLKRARRQPHDPVQSPLDRLCSSDWTVLIRDAVNDLPERRREIFVLVRYHQLSYREVAETLDISTQTVANQVSRALKDLRDALEPHVRRLDPQDLPFKRGGNRRSSAP